MNKVFWGFVLLLLLTTIEFRIDIGFLSIAIVEPFALAYAAIVLVPKVIRREPIVWRDPYFLLFALVTAWAIIIRPFSPDWKHGLSDIRDWLVPTAVLLALLNVTRPTGKLLHSAFVLVIMFTSLVGLYQSFTDSFRPFIHDGTIFKSDLTGNRPGSFAVGFFNSPNGFAMFLAAGIPFCFAWFRSHGHSYGWLRYGLLLIPALALYFTFSRTSLLVLMAVMTCLLLHYFVRSTSYYVQALVLLTIGAFGLFMVALNVLPHDPLRTFWWRFALWEIAGITLRDNPIIWLLGNGIDRFIPISFYPQPHNQTIFMLLEYGLMGLVVMGGIVGWTIFSGLRARAGGYLHLYPTVAPIWIGVCGQFLVTLTETNWIGVNGRLLFVCMVVLYSTLLMEASPDLIRLPSLKLPMVRSLPIPIPREHHS